jgi:deoxycytidylate deaminase
MSKRKIYQITATAFNRNGKILSSSGNDYTRSHTLSKHFALLAGESEYKDKVHAELGAVLKAGKTRVHSILVQRFNKDGNGANAKPCRACQCMLKAYGVKVVKFTTEDGIKEYIND